MTEITAPLSVGDVFTTAEHGDVVVAHKVVKRGPSVWSVAAQAVDADSDDRWVILTHEPIRWTSVKVYAGRSRIEILGKVGDKVG